MSYVKDYQLMISDKYIKNKSICSSEIVKLQKELQKTTDVKKALSLMTEIDIFKKVCNIRVKFQNVKDAKNPENVYIHARASILLGKGGKRHWIGHYVGRKGHITKTDKEIAETWVLAKALTELKLANL